MLSHEQWPNSENSNWIKCDFAKSTSNVNRSTAIKLPDDTPLNDTLIVERYVCLCGFFFCESILCAGACVYSST